MTQITRDFYHEDFRKFLERFPASADLIVTSPPYVDARTAGAYGVADAWTVQDDRDLGDAMFAALRPGGTAIVVIGAPVRHWRKGHGTERGLEPVRWLLDLVDRVGFTCRDVLTFGRLGLPGAYAGRFRNDYEPMLWLERPGGVPAFDKTPLDGVALYKTSGSGTERTSDGTMRTRVRSGNAVENGIKRRGTVWEYGNIGKSHSAPALMEAVSHPAAYPLALAADAVACFSRPGDLVLDPFSGRGTTALACARLGRSFAGGDLGNNRDGRPWVDVAAETVAACMVAGDAPGQWCTSCDEGYCLDIDGPGASASLCDGELSWCGDDDCGAAPFMLRDLAVLQNAAGLCEFETRPTGCRLTCGDVSVGCSLRPHGANVDSLCTLSSGEQFTVHHDVCRG